MLLFVLRLAAMQGSPADTVRVDACSLVPMDQLRFVVTAGLGRAFPVRENREGASVSLTEPKVVATTCPDLKVDLTVAVRKDSVPGSASVAPSGSVHLALALTTTAVFATASGKPAHNAAALVEAALCVQRVDVAALTMQSAPRWLTPEWVATRLAASLVARFCLDVTSLVYVYLQRGGTMGEASQASGS